MLLDESSVPSGGECLGPLDGTEVCLLPLRQAAVDLHQLQAHDAQRENRPTSARTAITTRRYWRQGSRLVVP